MNTTPTPLGRGRVVTGIAVRLSHGLMALSFTLAYLSGDSERWRLVHVAMGYTLAGLLVLRLAYGLVGPAPARLSLLWRRLAGVPAWWRAMRQGGPLQALPWRQGQNLLLPLSIVLILGLIVPLTLSGLATYEAWGGEWLTDALAEVHEATGELMLMTVLAHVVVIAGLSLLRRRNLALPMLTGRHNDRR